jgi:hypothetical protein
MSWHVPGVGLCSAGLLLAVAARVDAAPPTEPPPPPSTEAHSPSSADARREAARRFQEGTRAFDAGDYTRAGDAFEQAYALAPHEDPLWNAARAWHRAGDLARAANLYARYLREAPPNARDRGGATAALAQLAPKLGRIHIQMASGVEAPRLDGVPIEGRVVYAVPGGHVVQATGAQGPLESRQTIEAGGAVSVVLAPPATAVGGVPGHTPGDHAAGGASPPLPPPRPPDAARTARTLSGWSPVVVLVGSVATLAAVGFTIGSGVDTMNALHRFDSAPSAQGLDDGRAKQTRTNVALGASIGLAALTAVAALWLVDWGGGSRRIQIGVGPALAVIRGGF